MGKCFSCLYAVREASRFSDRIKVTSRLRGPFFFSISKGLCGSFSDRIHVAKVLHEVGGFVVCFRGVMGGLVP